MFDYIKGSLAELSPAEAALNAEASDSISKYRCKPSRPCKEKRMSRSTCTTTCAKMMSNFTGSLPGMNGNFSSC